MNGRFITIEGIEGVGKSTNLDFVADWLRQQGKNVVVTREPGGTTVAEEIREILLKSSHQLSSECELLLMFAARAAHLEEFIRPALTRGDWVVCDRFTDASYAYQGGGRGLPVEMIDDLKNRVQKGLEPDLTILLDVPMEISEKRRKARGGTDRFEAEQLAFFTRVKAAYLDIATTEPGRVRMVDASLSLPQVQERISAVLQTFVAGIDQEPAG